MAFFAITLDHKTGQRTGKKREVIPTWNFLEEGEPAHPITAKLRLDVDIVYYLRRKHEAAANNVGISFCCHDIFFLNQT